MMKMMMMIMMINCFCGMVDRRKAFSLISSWDHCQSSSPSRISDTTRAGFEPAQNLSSGLVGWSCTVVITSTPWRHKFNCLVWQLYIYTFHFSLNIKQYHNPKNLSVINILNLFFKIRTGFSSVSTFSQPGIIFLYVFCWKNEYILDNVSCI